MTPDTMTKDEKSCLVYLETCAVDYGGLAAGARMNSEDHAACKRFEELGLATVRRVPASLFTQQGSVTLNHFVVMTDAGFALAHELRKLRAAKRGPTANAVLAELIERGKLAPELAV
jgi:hypothetical protein